MARSIVDTLRHLEGGCLIDEASEKAASNDIVKAVREGTGMMVLIGNPMLGNK